MKKNSGRLVCYLQDPSLLAKLSWHLSDMENIIVSKMPLYADEYFPEG